MTQQLATKSYLGEGNERYVTAIHESGHVIAWLALGGTLDATDYVTVVPLRLSPTEALGGHFHHELRWSSRQEARLLAERFIVANCAGHQAEIRVNPDGLRSSTDDELTAEAFRRFIREGDFETYVRAREQQAAELVVKHWSQIVAFSKELLRRQTLRGPECHRLFDQVQSRNPGC